jgi:hypothetical protein
MPTFLDVLEKARASMFEDEEAKRVDSLVASGVGAMWVNRFISILEQQNPGICTAFLLTGKLYTSKGGEFVISLPDDMEDTPDPTEIPVIGKVGEYQTLIFWRDTHFLER